jgi:hypothetical protein
MCAEEREGGKEEQWGEEGRVWVCSKGASGSDSDWEDHLGRSREGDVPCRDKGGGEILSACSSGHCFGQVGCGACCSLGA